MELSTHPQNYLLRLKKTMDSLDQSKIVDLIEKIRSLIGTDRTVFIAGNGGSASTGSHMACDLGKTILGKKPRENESRLRTICLNDSIPLMTAWGNDEGYEHIFSEQLRNIGKSGDLLIIITGSGNSANIVEVVKRAKEMNVETYGILGFDGGKVKDLLDDYLLVDSDDYGVVEDIHMILVHLITDWLKRR